MSAAEELIEELVSVIRSILECPRLLDEATVPKAGIDAAPNQVVFNISCAYLKVKDMQRALDSYEHYIYNKSMNDEE